MGCRRWRRWRVGHRSFAPMPPRYQRSLATRRILSTPPNRKQWRTRSAVFSRSQRMPTICATLGSRAPNSSHGGARRHKRCAFINRRRQHDDKQEALDTIGWVDAFVTGFSAENRPCTRYNNPLLLRNGRHGSRAEHGGGRGWHARLFSGKRPTDRCTAQQSQSQRRCLQVEPKIVET